MLYDETSATRLVTKEVEVSQEDQSIKLSDVTKSVISSELVSHVVERMKNMWEAMYAVSSSQNVDLRAVVD